MILGRGTQDYEEGEGEDNRDKLEEKGGIKRTGLRGREKKEVKEKGQRKEKKDEK